MVAEYLGEIPADKREGVVQQLNEEVRRLIEVGSSEHFLSLKLNSDCRLFAFPALQDRSSVDVAMNENGTLLSNCTVVCPVCVFMYVRVFTCVFVCLCVYMCVLLRDLHCMYYR